MNLYLSAKLAKALDIRPSKNYALSPNKYENWYCDLFYGDRYPYIMLTNHASLFTVVGAKSGVRCDSELITMMNRCVRDVMESFQLEMVYQTAVAPLFARTSFYSRKDKSVIGSMNDLIYMIKTSPKLDEMSVHDMSIESSKVPMSAICYKYAVEAFSEMGRIQ